MNHDTVVRRETDRRAGIRSRQVSDRSPVSVRVSVRYTTTPQGRSNERQMDDQQLVDRAIEMDQEAWVHFVGRFRARIFGILVTNFRFSPDDAADVFQTVFVKFLDNECAALRAWTGAGPLAAYVSSVTYRAAIDKIRDQRRRISGLHEQGLLHRDSRSRWQTGPDVEPPMVEIPASQSSPFALALINERRDLVRDVSEAVLGSGSRELRIFRRWLEGTSYRVIAAEESMTRTQVGVELHRIRSRVIDAVHERLNEKRKP